MKKLILSPVILFSLFSLAYTQTAEEFNNQGIEACKSGNDKEGIKLFTKAISIDSNYIDAYNNRVFSYFTLKDYSKACKDWIKAYSLGVTNAKDFIEMYCK